MVVKVVYSYNASRNEYALHFSPEDFEWAKETLIIGADVPLTVEFEERADTDPA